MSTNKKGFTCGSNLIDGSVSIEKIEKSSLKEFIKEFLKESSDRGDTWIIDIINNNIEEYLNSDEGLKAICAIVAKCDEIGEFTVVPQILEYEATGGTKSFEIRVNNERSWEVSV